MKNIKVNLTNADGKRTSTTINGAIANFYWQYVCPNFHRSIYGSVDEYLKSLIEDEGLTTKQDIEHRILMAIHDFEPKQNYLDF